jgi:predicted Zn-dependent peptidase
MSYHKLAENIHLIYSKKDRKSLELELIYTTGGSYFEKPKDAGKKHLLEHCIVSRTKDLDFKEFLNYQFSENIHFNAYTGALQMGLEVSGHCSDFTKMFDLLLEVAFVPTFSQEILDQEKEIVLKEISERRGDPNYKLNQHYADEIFTPDSYTRHETLGDSEMVRETTLEDFKNLMTENLKSSQIVILAKGGGIDIDYITQKVNQLLAEKDKNITDFLETEKKPINYQITNEFQDFKTKIITHELAHEHIDLNFYIPCPVNFENQTAIKFFEELYLKFYGGKIYDKLRNELGLIYSMYGSFYQMLQVLHINLTCEIGDVDTITNEINKIFSGFEDNFEEQKFLDLHNVLKKRFEIIYDNPSSHVNYTVNTLINYNKLQQVENFLEDLQKTKIEDIKSLYLEIQKGWTKKRTVIMSKNPEISKFENGLR